MNKKRRGIFQTTLMICYEHTDFEMIPLMSRNVQIVEPDSSNWHNVPIYIHAKICNTQNIRLNARLERVGSRTKDWEK